MSGPVEIIVIVAAVVYVMARRLIGEPAEAKRMLLLPAVLTVIGVADLGKVAQSASTIAFLVGTTAVSMVIGLLRGASIRVFARDGIVIMRYTVVTVVLWAVNFAIKFGAGFALGAIDPAAAHAASSGLLLTLGAGMLVEGLTVLAKAMRSEGRIVWQKGRDGQPHTMSPYLDDLRRTVRPNDWSRGSDAPWPARDDPRDDDFRRPRDRRR